MGINSCPQKKHERNGKALIIILGAAQREFPGERKKVGRKFWKKKFAECYFNVKYRLATANLHLALKNTLHSNSVK